MGANAVVQLYSGTVTAATAGTAIETPINCKACYAHLAASSVTGTTPIFSWEIQHSPDNTNWYTVVAFSSVTGATSELKTLTDDTTPALLKYVRAKAVTVTGTSPSGAFVIKLLY